MPTQEFYDVCIVGSGPAGAFLAHELAQSEKLKVVVIESGNDSIDMDPNNFIDLSSLNVIGKLDLGFSRQVGGASNLWAGGLAKYDEIDFVQRESFGLPGWPFDLEELDEYYERVDGYLGIKKSGAELKEDSSIAKVFKSALEPREMRVLHFPFKTRTLVENKKNITLLKRCTAVQLYFKSKSKSEIEYLEIFDHSEKVIYNIRAKVFVVAAGAVSNVRILLNSFGKLAPNELMCRKNIGAYLSTHPKINLGTLELSSSVGLDHLFVSRSKYHNHISRYQFGLNENRLLSEGLLNHCVRFDSVVISRAYRIFDKLKVIFDSLPYLRTRSHKLSTLLIESGIKLFRFLEVSKFGTSRGRFVVRGFFDQAARFENRITLSDKVLEDGLPLADISWNFSKEDWANVIKFVEIFSKELEQEGIGKLNFKNPELEQLLSIHSHFIGGTRMGKDSSTSVVDKNLRLHGVNNLFVSGPSVFPSYGYANPFYTISALSLRLANYINSNRSELQM